MSDPLQTVWDALERAGCQPFGPLHQFRSQCPGHDSDKADSLAVGTGADGRALLWCHVGCDAHDIVRAVGLLWSDMFPEGHRHARQAARFGRRRLKPIDLTLAALLKLGITYRSTMSENMWVAAACPVCGKHDGRPLWITADDRGRIGLACFNGCPDYVILRALEGVSEELAA